MSRLITISFILLSVFAQAQENPKMSMRDAIEIGLLTNFDIRISEANEEIADNNNNIGNAGFLPNVTGNFNNNNTFSNNQNPASFLQGKFNLVSVSPSVAVDWVLFDGFRAWITKDRLDVLEEQSGGNTQIIVENTVQGIVLAYSQALVEQRKVEILKETVKLSRERYEYVLNKKELGSAGTFDVIQDKNAYLSDSSNLLTQELNYLNALQDLKLILGIDEDIRVYELSGEVEPGVRDYNLDYLREAMLRDNAQVKNQYINLEIVKKDLKLAKSELYPSLTMATGFSYDWNRFNADGQTPRSGGQTNFYINFGIQFTLFKGTTILTQIKNAQISEQIADLQIDQLEQSLNVELDKQFQTYEARRKIVGVNRANVANAKLNLDLATERYRNGTITSFEFRDIQIQYLSAEARLLDSLFALVQSETELNRLSGQIMERVQN
jgi:outer membrane protein TolC